MRRALSSLERYMLFFGRQYPLNFGFFVTVEGCVEESVIHKSLHDLKSRHGLPYSHQEYTIGKSAQLVLPEEPVILCSFIDSKTEWKKILLQSICRYLDPLKGPLFSVDYRYKQNMTEFFFVFQHGAADGIGAVYFIHDFLKLCAGIVLKYPDVPPLPVLYDVMKPQIFEELLLRPVPAWKTETPPPSKPFLMPEYAAPDFTLFSWECDLEKTARLATTAKNCGQTVHSYLGAKILLESAKIFGPQEGMERTIQCPVDFRQYLKEEYHEIVGVYNGIVKVKVDCTKSLETCAQIIKDGIAAERSDLKDIEGYFHFRDSFDNVEDPESLMMGFPPDPMDYDFSFSNLGRTLILPKYGDLKTAAFYGPIFTSVNGETVIGLNTTNGCLRMTMIFDSKIKKAQLYELLGKEISRIIEGL